MTLARKLKLLAGKVSHMEHERDQFKVNAERFKAERDELRFQLSSAIQDKEMADAADLELIPRIITAEELKVGMWAAWRHDGKWWAEVIEMDSSYSGIDGPFVLLADAPAKDVGTSAGPAKNEADSLHVTAEVIRQSEPGSTWDAKHKRSDHRSTLEFDGEGLRLQYASGNLAHIVHPLERILDIHTLTRATPPPRGTYPKRLTVADLDAAEVGSVLSAKGDLRERIKKSSGLWAVIGAVELALPSRALTTEGRTLTPPEPVRRGRVVKPEELRSGDEIDTWDEDSGKISTYSHKVINPGFWIGEEAEIRLISRKPPEHEDSPIQIHSFKGGESPRIAEWYEILKRWQDTDGSWFDSGEILDWTPLVPAGQEG